MGWLSSATYLPVVAGLLPLLQAAVLDQGFYHHHHSPPSFSSSSLRSIWACLGFSPLGFSLFNPAGAWALRASATGMGEVLEEWKRYTSPRHEVATRGLLAALLCSFLFCCDLQGYAGGCFGNRDRSQSAHVMVGRKGPYDLTSNCQCLYHSEWLP